MRPTVSIIAPDHDRPSISKDALVLVHIAYLVLHDETGAPYSRYTHTHLGTVSTYQWNLKGAGYLFDQQPVVVTARPRLYARVMRFIILLMLMLLTGRPLLQPGMEPVKIVASCFLKIGEVNRIIDVRQRV